MKRVIAILFILTVVTFTLTSCGVKGKLSDMPEKEIYVH
jgi:predicted small lipoprotein YifL